MSTKAKSPRKPLTPAQKAAKAAKAKATRDKKTAEELAAKEAEEKANTIEAEPEGIKPETVEAVVEALKSGQFYTIPKLVHGIDVEHPWKEEVISKWEVLFKKGEEDRIAKEKADKKAAIDNQVAKEKKEKARLAKKKKVVTFDDVLKKWQDSVDILKTYRDQQQKAGKAFTHIHVGYHRSNQFMLRFKRNQPK